jgi:hypothetical protein
MTRPIVAAFADELPPHYPMSKNSLDRGAAFGGATSVERKAISPTDPARYTASANSAAGYAYSDNYLINLKHAVIMDVEATTAIRQAQVVRPRRCLTARLNRST